jgi:hypothetical protein
VPLPVAEQQLQLPAPAQQVLQQVPPAVKLAASFKLAAANPEQFSAEELSKFADQAAAAAGGVVRLADKLLSAATDKRVKDKASRVVFDPTRKKTDSPNTFNNLVSVDLAPVRTPRAPRFSGVKRTAGAGPSSEVPPKKGIFQRITFPDRE